MTFKPCKLCYQDQDYRIDSEGRVYWQSRPVEKRIIDEEFLKDLFAEVARRRRNKTRRERDEAYRSCGLVKVRGALGGVYWE
jgi:hypothetical protein